MLCPPKFDIGQMSYERITSSMACDHSTMGASIPMFFIPVFVASRMHAVKLPNVSLSSLDKLFSPNPYSVNAESMIQPFISVPKSTFMISFSERIVASFT